MRVIRSLETRAQSKWESWFPLRTILAFKSLSKDSILAQSFQPVGLPCCNPWQHQSLATVTIPDTAFLLIKQASNQNKFGYSNKLLQGLQHFFLHLTLLSQLGITFFLSVWRGGLTQISSERIAALIIHTWFSEPSQGHLYCACPGGFVPFITVL